MGASFASKAAVGLEPGRDRATGDQSWWHRVHRPEVVVAAVALVARLTVVLRSPGGFHGLYDYDASVYYAAADGMVHGRVPYSSFTLVHPPLLPLMMTPFALLGRLTSASTGFIAANLVTMLIGALNAVLVVQLCRRFGLRGWAATVGGLVYAVWYGSVQSEVLLRLEPWCNTFLLAGLLALSATRSETLSSTRRRRLLFLAGALFGLGASVKIWGLLSCGIVVAWDAAESRTVRRIGPILLGTAAAGVAVNVPFLLLSRGAMWHMVVTSQFGRLRGRLAIQDRLGEITGLIGSPTSDPQGSARTIWLLFLAVVLAVCCVATWRMTAARVAIPLLVGHLVVLLASPSLFPFYADFMAVPFAILLAGLANALGESDRRAVGPALASVPVAAMAVAGLLAPSADPITPFHARRAMEASATRLHCITSDTPMMLIELNALDRSFSDGCRDWVDVTAGVLGVHSSLDHSTRKRFFQPHWANELNRYLLSGDGVIFQRTVNFGLTPAQRAAVDALPAAGTNGTFVLHLVPPRPRRA